MNKITRLLIVMSFFSIILIVPISFENTTLYVASIINLFFIIRFIHPINLKFNKKERILGVLISIYGIMSIFNLFIVGSDYILYTLNKLIPIVTMYIMIGCTNKYKIDLEKILKNTQLFLSFIMVGAFIMYIAGYSSIRVDGLSLKLIQNQYFYNMYGESRLMWIFTHKSRFAIVCLLSIGITLLNRMIGYKHKVFIISISLLNIYFSSSKTILALAIIILHLVLLKDKFKTRKEKILKCSIISMLSIFCVAIIPIVTSKLSQTRDIFSLGGRTYIWIAGILKSKENFFGIGKFSKSDWVIASDGIYTHAHNMFINEAIERGIIPGICFVIIFLYMLYMMKNSISRYIIIGCILSAMMDNTLTMEIAYIFWFIIYINYAYQNSYTYKNKENTFGEGI